MFDVGSKVVCINDTFGYEARRHMEKFPVKGYIYTVRDIIPAQEAGGAHTAAVLLVEVVNPPSPFRPDWGESGFSPERFREVEETEAEEENQTVATLTAMTMNQIVELVTQTNQ